MLFGCFLPFLVNVCSRRKKLPDALPPLPLDQNENGRVLFAELSELGSSSTVRNRSHTL